MTDGIRGLWVAVATPLDAAGRIDAARLQAHADWLLREGCDGLLLFGTTGEGTSFSAGERLAALEGLLRHGIAPDRLALGAGFPAVSDSIALARDMLSLGVVHALVLPPYFYRDAPAAGLEDAFAAIIEGVADRRLRMTLYHIPQVSGIGVPASVLAGLRARFGAVVAGLKDSSADFSHFEAFRAAAPEAAIVTGHEADIHRALAIGGTGTICGMANLVPGLVRRMFADAAAEAAMRKAIALMQDPFLPTLKTALAALSSVPGWRNVRVPLRPAPAELGERIAAALRGLTTAAAS